jgi:hypothetical protein
MASLFLRLDAMADPKGALSAAASAAGANLARSLI